MNTSTALVPRAHESQMQLVCGSLSDPRAGRTLYQVYSHAGNYIGKQVNRAAHRWGQGPCAIAERIADYFGTGSEREAKLEALHGTEWSEEECSKLIKYALPRETAQTQIQAFRCIVTIVTRYHGTRALFLKSKHLRAGNTEAVISATWARSDDMQPCDWDFHCKLAAVCLSEKEISTILGNISAGQLGFIDIESGQLSVIEHLLIELDRRMNSTSEVLARRYLAGILDLPTFWQQSGPIHARAFSKILDYVVCLLNDLELDSGEDETPSDKVSDNEGIDSIASAILVGVLSWRMPDTESQFWYRRFTEIVRLLRLPRAETLLPASSSLATGPGMGNLIPKTTPETFDILKVAAKMKNRQADNISLWSTGSQSNDSVLDLSFTPTIVHVHVQVTSFRAGGLFTSGLWSSGPRKTRTEAPGNERTTATKARAWILGRLRNFFLRHRQRIHPFEMGTRVFYWNGSGQAVYGTVQSLGRANDGTVIAEVKQQDNGQTISLPVTILRRLGDIEWPPTRIESNEHSNATPLHPSTSNDDIPIQSSTADRSMDSLALSSPFLNNMIGDSIETELGSHDTGPAGALDFHDGQHQPSPSELDWTFSPGTRVFYWNASGQTVYGTVLQCAGSPTGTVIVTVKTENGQYVALPETSVNKI
ncbi:hypothetical protein MVEN_01560000 [Mycena venus]|uniref:Uncharacterized protein n=1 Tax=Mycena venus TaxID=2733690 RepID=A0A8H6XP87_9AGAR|nr:hypothetical protein MVEN_01560000 [Mycena venus]